MKLDELDISIMKILQEDGRKSFRDIALQLNKPESTVRLRYNQLIENNILKIVAIPDPKQVGLETMAIICLKVEIQKLEVVAEAISNFKEVRFMVYTSGKYDLILEAYMKSTSDLVNFMTKTLSKIEGVTECDLCLELKFFKDTYNWLEQLEVE